MKIKYEILDEDRLKRLGELGNFSRYGYLAGGTSMALQVGHRYSYDFDLFLSEPIGNTLLKLIKTKFRVKQVLVNSTDEFSFLDEKDVKFTFLYYPFHFSGGFVKTKEGVKLLSLENIAASKAYTVGRRGNYRDYVDLYWLLRGDYVHLEKILKICKEVYGELFSQKMFLAQLNYFGDISKDDIKSVVFLDKKVDFREIKDYFEALVGGYIKKINLTEDK